MRNRTHPTAPWLTALALAAATLGWAAAAQAGKIGLQPALAQPYLLAGQKQTTFLKVGLQAFTMPAAERPPVNVSIVIDRSGSMSGQKLLRAKEAAIMAVDRLHPDDIVSVVAYDHNVNVLVPATKARDRETIVQGIRRLRAGGNTALFAGVSKGAEEVRKFLDPNRVNRVVLLSDGLANVGPSSPSALGALGASLGREGISVTTIGLGLDFNEDLMTLLARRSAGNHFFAATAADLQHGFELEFGVGLSVAAKEIAVTVACEGGGRPVRVYGAEADILGPRVIAHMNQLYAGREAYLLLEVEVPPGEAGRSRELARIDVSYANMQTGATDRLADTVQVNFTASPGVVERNTNRDVMVSLTMHVANERYKLATELRDQGKLEKAREVLQDNVRYLDKQDAQLDSPMLRRFRGNNYDASQNLAPKKWKAQRKRARDEQLEVDSSEAAY